MKYNVDGFAFEILHSGWMGPDKGMVLYGYSSIIPFKCPNVILTDIKVCDYKNREGCVYVKDNTLFIQHGFVYNFASGTTFDGIRIFSKKHWFAMPTAIHDAMCMLWVQQAVFGEHIFSRLDNDEWYYQNLIDSGCWKIRAKIHRAAVRQFSKIQIKKYFK